MPRRSSRAAPAPAIAASAPKRRLSARISTAKSPSKKRKPDSPSPSRSRSRSRSPSPSRKSARATARQSKYFDQGSADAADSDSDHAPEPPSADSSTANRRGGNRGQTKKRRSAGGDGNDEDGAHSDPGSDSEALKDKELWREGVKTGLGPGRQVFIKKPQMRDPGNVPYRDDVLHANTMLFLQDLRENNERQWLKGKRGHGYRISSVQVPV
jgi:hypothetical protein